MRICYITNARIPTEKAHGVAIMKACAAFTKAGTPATLVVPRRRNSSESAFELYGVPRSFSIVFLPTLDLFGIVPDRPAFALSAATFYISAALWLVLGSRKQILYTRDSVPLLYRWLGYEVVYECHRIPHARNSFMRRIRRAHKIVVISQALKEAFVTEGFDTSHILVAPSGVDLQVFDIYLTKEEARKELQLPEDAFLAVYTGNFTTMGEDKGLADVITALTHDPQIVVVAVGGSETDMFKYRKAAQSANVADRFLVFGHTTQVELAKYQKAADVLLMPFPDTPHYRNHMSPVKMFEYLAGKRAIIATDLPTIREVLDDSSARFVPPGNASALSAALRNLRDDSVEASRLAESAYAKAFAYTWDARASRILSFIALA